MITLNSKTRALIVVTFAVACAALTLIWPRWRAEMQSQGIYGDYRPCPDCPPGRKVPGGSAVDIAEGNLSDSYTVSSFKNGGTGLELSLTYNSFNADASHASINTVLGFGWTHSYNIFLFRQGDHMFRMDEEGRFTRFRPAGGGTFIPVGGYFETLVQNPDGTFALSQKDKTVFHFALLPDSPFQVGGPVYHLTSVADRNNNVTTLTYSAGDLTQITDDYGRSLTLAYDGNNKLASISDPLGRTTTLEYDAPGSRLLKITDPAGRAVRYSYNSRHQITGKADKDERTFSYVYVNNKPVAIKDGAGTDRFRLTNPQNWATLSGNGMRGFVPTTTTKTDGRSNVWRYDYDSRGFITRIIAPDGAATRYTYDPATQRLASMTDANGHTASHEYDALGNLTKTIDALGHVTAYTYEPVFSQMTSMTDPNGRVTTYEYDASGNRTRETDPAGHTREWTYDDRGNVLTERDKNGHLTAHEYDAFGNRIKTTDPLGNVTAMTYDAVGNLLSRTDANGHTTTFEYDKLSRPVREIDPFGKITRIDYDGEGNRLMVVDRNGNGTSHEYDLRKRMVKTTDALGFVTGVTYDGNDNRTSSTDKNAHTIRFAYDAQNRLTLITDALGNKTGRAYDPVGNLLSETDANGHATHYEYDSLNRRTVVRDAAAAVTRFEYDMGGGAGCAGCGGPTGGSSLITKQTDGNGKVTYFKYDSLDRLTEEIRKEGDTLDVSDASDAVTTFAYDPNGNRLSVTEPNGNKTAFRYDKLNRRITETNAAGDRTRFAYDAAGNLIRVRAPNRNITVSSYDANNRLTQAEDREGLIARYTYDNESHRLSATDGNGNTTLFNYDPIYRLTEAADPLGEKARYEYDAMGNLLKTTDRNGHPTAFTYDAINRRNNITDALGHVTKLGYDGVGNLLKVIDAKGQATEYKYDAVNRRISETYADPAPNTRTFTYDAVGNLLTRTDQKRQTTKYIYNDLYFLLERDYPVSDDDTFSYDLSGRVLKAKRGEWLVTLDYDGANRVTRTTQNGKSVGYAYDVPGREREVSYPGGRVITERMDWRNRKTRIDGPGKPKIVTYTYDDGNRVTSRAHRNGTVANYAYNANDWVTSLEHTAGAKRVVGFAYAYDKEGHKLTEEKRHDPAHSEAYQYDGIYRLTNFRVGKLANSTVPVTQTSYNLDQVGNWKSKTTNGVTENRTHNAANEITSINALPVSHDDNGNMKEDLNYRYTYDEENRLTGVIRLADGYTVGKYRYDALGRRVVKVVDPGGLSTLYFYDGWRVLEEQSKTGETEATYVYGNYIDEVLTMDRGGQPFYYHQDKQHSVFGLTNAAGALVEAYQYDAYGGAFIFTGPGRDQQWFTGDEPPFASGVIGNPFTFTGRELDVETGLMHFRARAYDTVQGRFKQRDPAGYVDGMNLYNGYFVPNSVDPSGMEEGLRQADVSCRARGFTVTYTNPIDGFGKRSWDVDVDMSALCYAKKLPWKWVNCCYCEFDDHSPFTAYFSGTGGSTRRQFAFDKGLLSREHEIDVSITSTKIRGPYDDTNSSDTCDQECVDIELKVQITVLPNALPAPAGGGVAGGSVSVGGIPLTSGGGEFRYAVGKPVNAEKVCKFCTR